jgi:uncharacterized protein (DUF2235 family)
VSSFSGSAAEHIRCEPLLPCSAFGLISKGNEALVPYAIRMLMAINTIDSKNGNRSAEEKRYFNLAADFKSTFSTQICKPWFVGVWHTVSSIGWYENPLRLPYTSNNPDIEIGRHAISIDERRAFFRTNLWMPKDCPSQSGPRELKQVWFPGVHSDVGGGYPEAESGLSKIALQWMLNEAINAGNWVKRQWERRPNLGRRRTIPPGSLIHESAYKRGGDYAKRLPPDAIPTR